MGVNFNFAKNAASSPDSAANPTEPQTPKASPPAATAPASTSTAAKPLLFTGAAAKKEAEKQEAIIAAAKEKAGKSYRFRIPADKLKADFDITFIDGHIDEDGSLEGPMWYEHTIPHAGGWENVVCINGSEPCPLCEAGDKADLMMGLTVIDHTPYTIKKGPKAGEIRKDQVKPYVIKRTARSKLQHLASKLGGLAGVQFSVARSDDKSPNTGDMFVNTGKKTIGELIAQYGEEVKPINYADELIVHSRKEMLDLGFGSKGKAVASGGGYSSNLDSELV